MKNKNKKNLYKSLILLTVLAIGIGYAYLTSNLSIAGSTEIANNTWDIHFDNLQVTSGSVTATSPATIDSNETSIEYAITLSRPKDFYEFTVDVKNDGTLPGKVSISELSGLDTTSSKVVDYTIAYTNSNPVNVGDILNAGAKKTIKVRVFYKDNISSTDLPSTNLHLDLTYTLQYVQSEESESPISSQMQQLIADNESCMYHYTDAVTDEVGVTKTNAENVYYNRCVDKRNILFANTCWQMIRTTETGGIKMIYNGEPDENGQCLSTRGKHIGYTSRTTQSMSTTYYYGTDYNYDKTNSVFSLSGTITTGEIKTGEYTCKVRTETGTCTTLYYVDTLINGTTYYVIPLNNNSNYAEYGELQYNQTHTSPADVGYMYNTRYTDNNRRMTSTEILLSSASLNTTYYYGDGVTWGSPTADAYNLNNPDLVSSTGDYPSLVGKYTFRNTSQTYTGASVYYIAAVNGSTMYYIQLQDSTNHNLSDYNDTYTYGDSYTDNGNGTYTIKNSDNSTPTTIHRNEWYTSYSSVKNKYVCKNATNNTCSELRYTTNLTNTTMTYIIVANNYKYANGFTYDENTGKYTLNNDSVSLWNLNDTANQISINNHHYTCFNTSGECETLYYIYFFNATTQYYIIVYYINLTNGKSIEDALNEMFSNVNNSAIKTGVDAWYKKYLSSKTSMLEDAVYCGARNMSNQSTNAWNPNGGDISTYLHFKNNSLNNDISCSNATDQFAVSNNKAKLTYPVALATIEELYTLTNNNNSSYYSTLTNTGEDWWSISPSSFDYSYADVRYIRYYGPVIQTHVSNVNGVRPVISLKPSTVISSGTGSTTDPFVIQE